MVARLKALTLAKFVSVSLLLLLKPDRTSTEMDSKALSCSIVKFAAQFCDQLEKNKSAVSSPLSAEFVLALLTLGATEPAKSELLTALGIPNDDAIRSAFSGVSAKLKGISGVTLDVANKVYVKEGPYELVAELEKDAKNVFDAAIEKVNFDNGAAAANLINQWVESKTNKRIKDLLSPDSLSSDTRLVLVNALYFKGNWSKQFNRMHTRDQTFHVNSQTTIEVPMMYKESEYRYGISEELQAQLLEMSYVGEQASMLIILPNEIEGLDGVMKKLAGGYDLMADVEKKMFSTKVQVTIPKFKIETEIDLLTLLPKLGIKAIFNRSGSGLDNILQNGEPLYVSKAVQKAFIEVNEEGAEAAAATGMVMMLRCAMISPQFLADRPFLYLLVGPERNTLFAGVYCGSE